MKALSLMEPWAALIAAGVKSIETRSWRTAYRGPLYIHASRAKVDQKGPHSSGCFPCCRRGACTRGLWCAGAC